MGGKSSKTKVRGKMPKSGRTVFEKGNPLNRLRGKIVKRPTAKEREAINDQLKKQKPRKRKKWSGAL